MPLAFSFTAFAFVAANSFLFSYERGVMYGMGFLIVALLCDFHRWLTLLELQLRIKRLS